MFKRRIKLTSLQKAKEALWPKMGWVRAVQYFAKRMIRLRDSNASIAVGLATGASVSFSPLIGTHILQAGLFTYILRGNLLASLVGTVLGNPWTLPFMWWISLSLGSWLFSLFGLPADAYLPQDMSLAILWDLTLNQPLRVALPWFVGGYLCTLITWPIFYGIFFYVIKGAKTARHKAVKG